jgi:hypothetical protein
MDVISAVEVTHNATALSYLSDYPPSAHTAAYGYLSVDSLECHYGRERDTIDRIV